jgi:hypothetical protein
MSGSRGIAAFVVGMLAAPLILAAAICAWQQLAGVAVALLIAAVAAVVVAAVLRPERSRR